ncbi:hypothetical protein GpartN1_g6855.t1 [Galdieria partita]|uniref:GrpE protein homolog n=1 Tax=Galdieria partita TaxID=83374 RepID=A0A9C7Q3D0_9RHOD|nr:hypothetical protein GpartN1_g6855.t1 [Galdieria partita]
MIPQKTFAFVKNSYLGYFWGLSDNLMRKTLSTSLEKLQQPLITSAYSTTTHHHTQTKDTDGNKSPPTNSTQTEQENKESAPKESTTFDEQYKQNNDAKDMGLDPEEWVQKFQEQEQQIAKLKDLSMRAYAEMENVRKIAQRDVDNARKYSIGAFAKDLLDVADNLERALQNIPTEKLDPEKGDAVVISLYEGVKATNDVLQKVFRRYGIERYDPMGEKFDPNLHQAMFEIPDKSNSGVVLAVAKTGYKIQDRILRPAEVGVSKVTSQQEE